MADRLEEYAASKRPSQVVQIVCQQETARALKPRSAHRPPAPFDLVCVEVQSRDAGAGGFRDVDHRSTDSASDIGDRHARPEVQELGHASFLAALRGKTAFPGSSRREVEGLPPTVLVELGDDIVVPTHHLRLIANSTIPACVVASSRVEEVVKRLPQAATAVRPNGTISSLLAPVIFTPELGHGLFSHFWPFLYIRRGKLQPSAGAGVVASEDSKAAASRCRPLSPRHFKMWIGAVAHAPRRDAQHSPSASPTNAA